MAYAQISLLSKTFDSSAVPAGLYGYVFEVGPIWSVPARSHFSFFPWTYIPSIALGGTI